MNRTRIILCSFLSLLIVQSLFAQNFTESAFSFRHLSVENGLSQNTVFCILQDHKGYMWFGTEDGLNRFDGYNFKYFRHDPFDNSTISSSVIISISQSKSGLLFIGTDGGGLSIFNSSANHFEGFMHEEKNENSISSNRVTAICQYNDSLYWVATLGGGLNLFNSVTKKFQRIKVAAAEINSLSNSILKMISDEEGKLYLGTRNGFYVFNPLSRQFKSYQNEINNIHSISNNYIQSIYDDGNNVWIGTYDGVLNCFNKQTERISRFTNMVYPNNQINDIIRVSVNSLWLATRGGLSVFNEKENTFKNTFNDPFNVNSISNNNLYTFFKSSDSLFWIGTAGSGLNLYHKRFNFINIDQQFIKNTLNYTQNNLSIFIDADELIWSGSRDGGLRAYDKKNDSVLFFKNSPVNKNSLTSNSVWSLYADDENNMWVGTVKGGLNCFKRQNKNWIHYGLDSTKANSLNSNNILCITQTKDKKLWLGTQRGGVNVFDKLTEKFFHYTKDSTQHSSVNSNTVYCLKEGKGEDMLIGTQGGGLNILNGQDGKFEYYLNDPGNKNSVSNNNVQCIYEDKSGLIWLGTSGGLNVFDRRKKIFHYFTEKDGMPNNVIYGILPDDEGSLWISTNKGICKFSYPSTLDIERLSDASFVLKNIFIQKFDHNDGLISDEFNQGAYFKSPDGTFYFGGVKGIVSFKPSEITSNTFIPPTVITRIKNYKEEIPFNDSSEIVLEHKNYLTVEFASLSYIASEKNKYAFMVEGRDTTWNDLGTNRTVSFLDLKPGAYILKIRSSNNDGIWGNHPAEVKITVNPPFYETWWFRFSVLIFIAVTILWYFNSRIRKIKREEAQKTAFNKSLAEVEMKALRAQMNPHFIFNSLQSIGKYMMNNDKENANEYLSRFSKLMRLILENSRKQEVSLEKDLTALELYMQLESLRFKQRFQYNIEVDMQIDKEITLIPPLLLQPFVENSILHGIRSKENGIIKLNIRKENDMLLCILEDNGMGREQSVTIESGAEKKRESLGMKITQERLNIINQQKKSNASVNIIDLKDEENKPAGLRVELILPFEQEF